MQYKIEQIAGIIKAERHGNTGADISWLLTDSRSLCFPEETLFFAIKTKRNDGHRYISELYKNGVRNFVVSELPDDMPNCADANFLVVSDTLQALQQLAEHHRMRFDIPVIAITGSNGKTTVKEWLYQLLSPSCNVCRSPRSYNSQIGVPMSLWLIGQNTDLAVIEAGISMPGEMQNLASIIKPTIGVITNIGEAHQENFASYKEKCREKMCLLSSAPKAVLNMNDPAIKACRNILPETTSVTAWHDTANDASYSCDITITDIKKNTGTTDITVLIDGAEHTFTIPFIDDASIRNSLTCLAVCTQLQQFASIEDIMERMSRLEPVAMRMEVKNGRNGCTLINDTYNSDIHSLDIALDFMSRRPDTSRQKRTLILSDILQSGETAEALYSRVASLAESRGISKIIGVGKDISSCAHLFNIEKYFFASTEEFISSHIFRQLADEFILIKGARSFHFERISDLLTQKVHQTILEVNLNALVDNVNYYRSFMKPETKMVCMIKASAYGMGSVEVAKTLQDHNIDYLAVAVADEGVDLRNAGITSNIMIMNPETTSFHTLFDYRLEPEVFSFSILEALIHEAEREGITNFPIHIKLDTGMHRLGFDPEHDMEKLISILQKQNALVPRSVFSHFVGSDGDEFDSFSRHQFELYDKASRKLQQAYSHKILRHICNSAGIEHFPEYHLDMVRLGLGLYGINPRNNAIINNVATLKTTILQIRDVPSVDTVGYSRKGHLTRNSRIAAIPIGYADGLNRHLGNGHCYCLVNGKKAPYVGNICMDVCMIDVTDIDCHEGDTATIFGDDLPVTVLSDVLGTIPYEVLTCISTRVQHVYIQE